MIKNCASEQISLSLLMDNLHSRNVNEELFAHGDYGSMNSKSKISEEGRRKNKILKFPIQF